MVLANELASRAMASILRRWGVGKTCVRRHHRCDRLLARKSCSFGWPRPRKPTWPALIAGPPDKRSMTDLAAPDSCGAGAEYLHALATGLEVARPDEVAQMWPREVWILYSFAEHAAAGVAGHLPSSTPQCHTFPFEEVVEPTAGGEFGLLVREPVGVVGAIVAWNGPLGLISRQDRPRPAGRLHRYHQILPRGAWRGLCGGRSRRVDRPAARCVEHDYG